MSDLAQDLASLSASGNDACKLCETLQDLKTEDAEAVRKAIAKGVSNEHLWKVLKIHGHQTPMRHIRDHKREGHK